MHLKPAEEPPEAVLTPVVGALVALEATELLLRVVQTFAPPRLRWDAVAYPFLPLAVAMLLPGVLGARAGRAGLLMLACGLGLTAGLMLRFRGLWTWDGSFDHYWRSPHAWMIALVGGATLGFILGKPFRARAPLPARGLAFLMAVTLIVSFVNWTLAHVWAGSIDSFFPPTRLFATGGIVLALGALWYARTFTEQNVA